MLSIFAMNLLNRFAVRVSAHHSSGERRNAPYITMDGAAVNGATAAEMLAQFFWCAAHRAQLAVRDAMKTEPEPVDSVEWPAQRPEAADDDNSLIKRITDVFTKARALSSAVRSSIVVTKLLEDETAASALLLDVGNSAKELRYGEATGVIPSTNVTRWSSDWKLGKCLLRNKAVLQSMFAKAKPYGTSTKKRALTKSFCKCQ